jgi:hypothetical protein
MNDSRFVGDSRKPLDTFRDDVKIYSGEWFVSCVTRIAKVGRISSPLLRHPAIEHAADQA